MSLVVLLQHTLIDALQKKNAQNWMAWVMENYENTVTFFRVCLSECDKIMRWSLNTFKVIDS